MGPVHMLKLVWNQLESQGEIMTSNDDMAEFELIEELLMLLMPLPCSSFKTQCVCYITNR